MSITDAASEARSTMNAAAAAAPEKAAAARAALADLGSKTRDLIASLQARARSEIERRRSDTADRLENLASAIRSPPDADQARNKALVVAGASTLALAAVLGAGVAIGVMVSRNMKKRAEQRALAEPEAAPLKEVPPPVPALEQAPVSAGLSH